MAESGVISATIAAAYRRVHDLVRDEIKDLDAEALNWSPGPKTNSIAVLVTHLLGSEIEVIQVARGLETNRDRPAEFTSGLQESQDLLNRLDEADGVLEEQAGKITDDDLSAMRTRPTAGETLPALEMLVWNFGHAREHLGQILLTKQLYFQSKDEAWVDRKI
jgi:uncharacterized damage-inducible protein DinB